MDAQWVLDWSQEAIRMAIVISLPVLATALVAGVVLGLLQTIMQLNEATFAQIPRMIVVSLAVMLLLPWIVSQWVGFTTSLMGSVANGL
ncbi:MAG: flagellar biosynthetic protein FliQ [bacterium]